MIYKVFLNDDIYLDIIIDDTGARLSPRYHDNLNEICKLQKTDYKTITINIIGRPYAYIDLTTKKLTYIDTRKDITTTEIKNYLELLKDRDNQTKMENAVLFFLNQTDDEKLIQTELHTHFMEVLSGEELFCILHRYLEHIEFIEDKIGTYFVAEKNNNESSVEININTILNKQELFQKVIHDLSLPVDRQVQFKELSKSLSRRNTLINNAATNIARDKIKKIEDDPNLTPNQKQQEIKHVIAEAKGEIYVKMLCFSLEKLKLQGIKYVELSYSNHSTITRIYNLLEQKNIHIEGIEFRFLLSENRSANATCFNKISYLTKDKTKKNKNSVEVNLEKLINEGKVVGFDLMGLEEPISDLDFDTNETNLDSLYIKLHNIVPILNKSSNSVMRLHAGEGIFTKGNPEKTLEIINMIAKNKGLTLPPPEIRIGHGLHIKKTKRYLELLKQYQCIIEINASSNFALSNIEDLKAITYRWYYENNIPMVISTDGGGFYLTSPLQEKKLAEIIGGKEIIESIITTDNNYANKQRS